MNGQESMTDTIHKLQKGSTKETPQSNGQLRLLMDINKSYVLLIHFSLFEKNVKCILHSENSYIFQNAKYYIEYFKSSC